MDEDLQDAIEEESVGATSPVKGATVPTVIGLVGLALVLGAAGVLIHNLNVRPACPTGWNRLIDLGVWAFAPLGLLGLFDAILVFGYDRRTATARGLTTALSFALPLLVASASALWIAAWIVRRDADPYTGCWTF